MKTVPTVKYVLYQVFIIYLLQLLSFFFFWILQMDAVVSFINRLGIMVNLLYIYIFLLKVKFEVKDFKRRTFLFFHRK